MLSVENITVEFGATPLFCDATFVIGDKERIALVGKNGAGKSTMLKILAGMQNPSSGRIVSSSETTVGYLPQVMHPADTCSVREEVEKAFTVVVDLRSSIERVNRRLSERTDYESEDYMALVDQFTHLNERFQIMGGMNCEAELEQTLIGLGFRREDFGRPTSELSGGWRMRVELAKLLLCKPSILLLDEPTNHLDIESIRWLEDFLCSNQGALVLVSHDRAFLNNVTQRTLEITCGKVVDYKVKYDDYVRIRSERREQQLRAYQNQQKEIKGIKDFIERFRYKPTKAAQVQSRIKQLERIVPVQIDDIDNAMLHLKFPEAMRSGDFPLICNGVYKAFGSHVVLSGVTLSMRRGDKVAFVGRNGAGKSTFVKCIMGEIPCEGELKIGHNVQLGYFAQNQAQLLDEELTVFETIDHEAKGDVRLRLRDILGAFMFGGDASDKKVKVLSGGERSRLAMIKLLLQSVNFLILDEPTNHLDMRSKDVLKEAIRDFTGTVIIVSHDRDFLDGLVGKVYEFADGCVREHLGGIYDFLNGKPKTSLFEQQTSPNLSSSFFNSPNTDANQSKSINKSRLAYEQQKESIRHRRRLEKKVADIEKEVSQLEADLRIVEHQMSMSECPQDTSLYSRYDSLKKQLDDVEVLWEKSMEELERFLSEGNF